MAYNPTYLGQTPQPAPTPTLAPSPGTAPVKPYVSSPHQIGPTSPGTVSQWRRRAETELQRLGADLSNLEIQGRLAAIEQLAPTFEQDPSQFDAFMAEIIGSLRASGLIIPTVYEKALQLSGFGTEPIVRPEEVGLGVTTPSELAGAGVSVGPQTQPRTGWIQFPSGVLVDPAAPLGDINGVYFPPGSTAPGSRGYFQSAQSWSQEKVNEWRKKLVDLGYLTEGEKKGAYDVTFENGLALYQRVKYQNGGKAIPWTGTAALQEVQPFNFQQLQGQIRNGIRAQYQRIYGDDPTDAELQEWQDFIINTSHKLYQRGQLAPGEATVEAEERFVERLEQTPEAQFVIQNLEENTQLRDSILRAVMVAQGMS